MKEHAFHLEIPEVDRILDGQHEVHPVGLDIANQSRPLVLKSPS